MLVLSLNKIDSRLRGSFIAVCGIYTAYAAGSMALRHVVPSPQAKDIHTAYQVNITDDAGKQTVLTNGDAEFEGVNEDADIRPQFKSMVAVADAAEKIIGQNQSIGLRSVRVSGHDVIDGESFSFTLPNGRGTSVRDENGKTVPVPSLRLGNSLLAYDAIRYIRDEQKLYETFDQNAKKPKTAEELKERERMNWWYSSKTIKFLHDYTPRFSW